MQIRSKLDNSNNTTLYAHNIEKLLAYSEQMNMSIKKTKKPPNTVTSLIQGSLSMILFSVLSFWLYQ